MEELNQELAEAAYEKYLPAAQALPADQVLEYRLDVNLAINNIDLAMAVVEKHRADIPTHLPKIPLDELEGLPSLALATKMSAMLARGAFDDSASPSEMISEGWKLRGILLPVVGGLAAIGAIPQEVYDRIVSGRGPRDMAEDCVGLSRVFTDYKDQVEGKHGVDPEIIARAATVGSWLLQNLRSKYAPRPASAAAAELDIRDRMATLLVQRYKKLRTVAYYFYQDDFGDHVPLLMSRHGVRRPKAEAEAEAVQEPTAA